MKLVRNDPPRRFRVGPRLAIEIADCGRLYLEPDEQVTFVTASAKRYDFTAKSWGYYATPSVNARLIAEGFKTALVRNRAGKYFIMVVDADRVDEFSAYLQREENELMEWIDERQG